MRRVIILFTGLTLLLILAACSNAGKQVAPTVTVVAVTLPVETVQSHVAVPTFTPTLVGSPVEASATTSASKPTSPLPPSTVAMPTFPQPHERVQAMQADLAKRVGLDITQVQYEKIVTGSLPEGAKCLRNVLPIAPFGMKEGIQFRAGKVHYLYFSNGEQVQLCVLPAEGKDTGGMNMKTMDATQKEQILDMARRDLSQRLGVALDKIEVVSTMPVQWSDASLGCPQPGQMYAQVITPGLQIVLKVNGKSYEYHTSYTSVVLCK